MSVKVSIFDIGEATITGLFWSSNNFRLAQLLNNSTSLQMFSGSDSFHDLTEAERVVAQFGGEIIKVKNRPKLVEERVY